MSDWRQIQARIRKARTSPDPSGQLAALYEHTHDAMVAFELAQLYEKSGTLAEAIRWYASAAERFRRAQWKQKAEEALARLGAPIAAPPAIVADEIPATISHLEPIIAEFPEEQTPQMEFAPEIAAQEARFDQPAMVSVQGFAPGRAPEPAAGHRRKRRGRRGGRGRNKGLRAGNVPVAAAPTTVQAVPSISERFAEPHTNSAVQFQAAPEFAERPARGPESPGSLEPAALGSVLQVRTRAGDPALSSRMVKLESQLRRLLACTPHSVDQPDEAPAGPGVFLITDTDQTGYYYIEACQTLRVGIGNLLRSGRGSREGVNLKGKLADHLGINESRVAKYLKDNCAVRWLQLDEGAPLLAHFAVAVLRPIANE